MTSSKYDAPSPAAAGRMGVRSPGDPATEGLDVYVVGGAVRDQLLGEEAGDRDWVVVGATPEEMVRRGFIPVGGDFPVFLHPESKEEYALARTERKSGRGYKGFTFYTGLDVTLEQDLKRRDLTVNAMAQTTGGEIVDPLEAKPISKREYYAMLATRSWKIRCVYCVWRDSLPVSQTFRWPMKLCSSRAGWWPKAKSTPSWPSASGKSWQKGSWRPTRAGWPRF